MAFLCLELMEPALDVTPQLASDLPRVCLNPTWQPHHLCIYYSITASEGDVLKKSV